MSEFVVSARKYRPSTFNTVVGQKSITSTLKNAIRNNHLAQAFLFCGPRGVGKTTCARILAKTINCFNITDATEACDQCESCVSFNENASFNIHELDAASNNSVDDIRNLVDQVRFAPQVGKYSIYIIDEVHMLSTAAFNAFLKTLEEPPKHAIFILATTERHKIIPTILSRCQIFDFKRIQIEDMVEHLLYVAKSENIEAEHDALHIIAQKADGAMRDSLSMFDQIVSFAGNKLTYKAVIENLNILDYDYYFRISAAALENNIPEALVIFNEILDNGFDGHNFINGLGSHFRNLLVCKDISTIQLLEVGQNIKDKYMDQSQRYSMETLLRAINITNKCDINYKTSKNQRLQVELALMQICSLTGSPQQGEPEKKNLINNPSSVSPTAKPQETSPVLAATVEKKAEPPIAETPGVKEPAQQVYTKRIISGTTSINTSGAAKAEVKPTEVESENAIAERKAAQKNFTQEELNLAWKKSVQQLQQQNKLSSFAYTALTKSNPVLKENFLIELEIDNEAAEKALDVEKLDFLEMLRKELLNTEIQLTTVINYVADVKKLYTQREKFMHMAEKNPSINKLRQQLDLEID
ncbi:MAG: DNA polymerase III subunit gamma/tau [Bacteroidia bacterium]